MDVLIRFIGTFLLCVGGMLAAMACVGLLGWLACKGWIAFSNTFRTICKTENVIRHYSDYLEHKDEFDRWKRDRGSRGEWRVIAGTNGRRRCSCCGWDVPPYGMSYSFCPNCGAEMTVPDGSAPRCGGEL